MTNKPPIRYSCYFSRSSKGEQFVPEHTLVFIISGSLVMTDNSHTISFDPGDIYFCRRNNLVKYLKCPPDRGEYQSISIYFDQQTLRNISLEYEYKAVQHDVMPGLQRISSPEIGNYMRSLLAYETILKRTGTDELLFVKQKEAILLPSRWLQERRLQEAYYLIKEQRKTPSDAYLDVGFEDLSHFSFVFKKKYGIPPSKL
jgi:AraC family transcriptional regulator, exoenzyme S synthesis regulatory protein ExsA